MKIEKVFWDEIEVTKEKAQELYEKYVTSEMVRECFWAGIAIKTPDGVLQAQVSLN